MTEAKSDDAKHAFLRIGRYHTLTKEEHVALSFLPGLSYSGG